jgi:hypothetical protein
MSFDILMKKNTHKHYAVGCQGAIKKSPAVRTVLHGASLRDEYEVYL